MLSTWFLWIGVVTSALWVLRRVVVHLAVAHHNTTNIKARIGLERLSVKPRPPYVALLVWVFWLVLYVSNK